MLQKLLAPACIIAIGVISTTSMASAESPPPPLVFSAMGCGPYTDDDADAVKFYLRRENALGSSKFLVHLGDINSGKMAADGHLTEAYYAGIKSLLTVDNKIPTYIVPGDNEWNDRPDPDVGWKHWSKHLLKLEESFETKWVTERQEGRPENFAFVCNGVLIIGINLPAGRVHDHEEWTRRFGEDNDWIEKQFAAHRDTVRAAVVCAQANIVGQGKVKTIVNLLFSGFRKRFGELSKGFGKPVLFLHADGHKWTIDKPWKDITNITRIQVDRLNPSFPPVQITVDPTSKTPFAYDRRLKDPAWKPPVPGN
jgi:hypothetical protein